MQAVVDNLLTNYAKVGNGPLVLLLHGWGDSLATYDELQKSLSANYTVVSLDLPGFGSTQAPAKAWKLDDYAKFVSQFLKKLNLQTPYAIIGHSNGGSLAIYGLAQNTLSAQKLILLGAAGIRDKQKIRRLLLKVVAKVGKTVTFWLPVQTKRQLQKKLYGAAGSDMLTVPHMQETFKQTVRQDVQTEAAKLQLPTLLIYGQNDKATPPSYGKVYNQLIKGSRLEVIPDADHFVHQTQAAKVLAFVEDFLK